MFKMSPGRKTVFEIVCHLAWNFRNKFQNNLKPDIQHTETITLLIIIWYYIGFQTRANNETKSI